MKKIIFLIPILFVSSNSFCIFPKEAQVSLHAAVSGGRLGGIIALGIASPLILLNHGSIKEKIMFPLLSGLVGTGASFTLGFISSFVARDTTLGKADLQEALCNRAKIIGAVSGTVTGIIALTLSYLAIKDFRLFTK